MVILATLLFERLLHSANLGEARVNAHMAGSAVIYRLLGESISSLSLLRLGTWRSWLLRVMLLRQSLLRKIRLRAMLIARYYYFAGSALRGTPYGEGALGRVRLRGKLLKEKLQYPVCL